MTALLWLVAIGGLGGRLIAAVRLRRLFDGRWTLGPTAARPKARVSVLVPARNEEAAIDVLLASLDAQDHDDVEVIVVDDHSTDRTVEIARAHRCHVSSAPPLPEGWMGKCWALHHGAALATGDILLFVDADTTHHPAAVRTVAAEMADCDALVVLGRQRIVSLAERVVPPLFWSLVLSLLDPPRHADPALPDDALGNGQFAAYRAEVYRAAGGHAAVRDRIVEDVALARVLKRAGARSRIRLGPELTSTRMYDGWASVWRGFSKNAAVVDPERPVLSAGLTLAAALLVAQAELWPWVAFGLGPGLALAGAIQLALVLYGRVLTFRHACAGPRFDLPALILQPVGAVVGIAIMLNSLRLGLGGGANWKGRRVRGRSL